MVLQNHFIHPFINSLNLYFDSEIRSGRDFIYKVAEKNSKIKDTRQIAPTKYLHKVAIRNKKITVLLTANVFFYILS